MMFSKSTALRNWLNYALETWEYSKAKEIERIHLTFCKRILNVKPNNCNATVYSELGRYTPCS